MGNLLEVHTTDDKLIVVDVSDEACLPFGFKSKETAINPNGNMVTFIGVASNNKGHNVLWYEINHPKTKGKVCCWGGKERNLLKAGFEKISD